MADANGRILEFDFDGPFNLDDPKIDKDRALPPLVQGTLIRHYNYACHNLDGPLISTPGNFYHFLGAALPDPIIPFRVKDARPEYTKDRTAIGSGFPGLDAMARLA